MGIIDGKYVNENEVKFFEEHNLHDGGHRISWYDLREWLSMRMLWHKAMLLQDEKMIELGKEVNVYPPFDGPVKFTLRPYNGCQCCGELVPMYYDGRDFYALDACKYRFGGIPLSFTLDVPSGAIAVGNDFRDQVTPHGPPEDDVAYYVNNEIGTVNTSLWYAEHQLAHAFVSNTCPGMHRLSDTHYQISSGRSDDEDNYYEAPGELVASICTDLWWFSIMDAAVYEERGGNYDNWTLKKVEIKPGVWRFDHHWSEKDFDPGNYREDTIYTDITWLGEVPQTDG